MSPEDAAVYLADPEYAKSIGISAPRCQWCGKPIKNLPDDWKGEPVTHLSRRLCRFGEEPTDDR